MSKFFKVPLTDATWVGDLSPYEVEWFRLWREVEGRIAADQAKGGKGGPDPDPSDEEMEELGWERTT